MVQRVGAGTLESCAMHGGVDDCRGGSGGVVLRHPVWFAD